MFVFLNHKHWKRAKICHLIKFKKCNIFASHCYQTYSFFSIRDGYLKANKNAYFKADFDISKERFLFILRINYLCFTVKKDFAKKNL